MSTKSTPLACLLKLCGFILLYFFIFLSIFVYICVSLYCQDQSRGSNYLVASLSQIYCPNFPPSSPPFIHLYSQSTFRAVGQKIFFKRLKSYHAGNDMKPPRKKTQSSNLQITKITRPSRSPKTPEAE